MCRYDQEVLDGFINADGPLISFQLEAHDEHEQIAIGTHKLRIIQAERLARRVKSKTQPS